MGSLDWRGKTYAQEVALRDYAQMATLKCKSQLYMGHFHVPTLVRWGRFSPGEDGFSWALRGLRGETARAETFLVVCLFRYEGQQFVPRPQEGSRVREEGGPFLLDGFMAEMILETMITST
jgi:hypothetical protein